MESLESPFFDHLNYLNLNVLKIINAEKIDGDQTLFLDKRLRPDLSHSQTVNLLRVFSDTKYCVGQNEDQDILYIQFLLTV